MRMYASVGSGENGCLTKISLVDFIVPKPQFDSENQVYKLGHVNSLLSRITKYC